MAKIQLTLTVTSKRGRQQVIAVRMGKRGWDVFTANDPFSDGSEVRDFPSLTTATEFAIGEAEKFVGDEPVEANSVWGTL